MMMGLRKTKINISTADFTPPISKTLPYSLRTCNITSDALDFLITNLMRNSFIL